jgi:hypothetical protein
MCWSHAELQHGKIIIKQGRGKEEYVLASTYFLVLVSILPTMPRHIAFWALTVRRSNGALRRVRATDTATLRPPH